MHAIVAVPCKSQWVKPFRDGECKAEINGRFDCDGWEALAALLKWVKEANAGM